MLPSPSPISESELSIPVLLALAHASENKLPGLTTTQLRSLVVKAVTPSQEDRKVLANGEIRIERLVRNTISSHKSMEKQGYVKTKDGMTAITLKGQQRLVGFLVALMSHQVTSDEVAVPATLPDLPGVTESQLLAPALMEMVKAKLNGSGPLSTAKLIAGITANVPMGKQDYSELKSGGGRGERIIRNLRSHRSLVKGGLATIEPIESSSPQSNPQTPNKSENGETQKAEGFEITDKGWQYLLSAYLQVVPAPDFSTLPERSPPGLKAKIQAKFKAQRRATQALQTDSTASEDNGLVDAVASAPSPPKPKF